jgi:hypothetical protein
MHDFNKRLTNAKSILEQLHQIKKNISGDWWNLYVLRPCCLSVFYFIDRFTSASPNVTTTIIQESTLGNISCPSLPCFATVSLSMARIRKRIQKTPYSTEKLDAIVII